MQPHTLVQQTAELSLTESIHKENVSFLAPYSYTISMRQKEPGFVVITTNCANQQAFWQKKFPSAIVIFEDWPGGAGNALGTLYAFQKANLMSELKKGKSVALYHTAGKGTRLAPLPGSESNNKSAVKLPGFPPITLLEAVIRQTAPLATPGRLSVFWGDQLFFPSIALKNPTHDVEIFTKIKQPPTEKEWEQEGLSRYGLLLINHKGHARQFEKIDYATYLRHRKGEDVGISLGSFSLSTPFLEHLLSTYRQELETKTGKLDTDRDLWMPLSRQDPSPIGVINIGDTAPWLDFGTLRAYWKSCLAITNNAKIRQFLNLESCISGCEIEDAEIDNSILINVCAKRVKIKDSILINVSAPEIEAQESLIYNVTDQVPISIDCAARADAHRMAFTAPLDGADWDTHLSHNPMSFSKLYELNSTESSAG